MNEAGNSLTRSERVWWLHPVAVFVGLNGLTGIAAFLADPDVYVKMWRTPKYFDGLPVLLTAAIIIVFSAGVWLALARQSGPSPESEWGGTVSFSQAWLLFNVSYWICVLAYVFWAGLGISRGLGISTLKSVFIGG